MTSHISFKKRIAFELFRQFRKNTTKIHELTYLFWECTLRCNLNCLHCGSECKKEASLPDMPVSDFLKAIDTITPIINPNKTMIVFTGGEALMRKDLEKCGVELYKRGFPWGVVTNGMLLDKARMKSLSDAGMRSITISLDGLEESHNWLRGNKNSFGKATEAVRLLPLSAGLKYDVVTCVNRRNIDELNELRESLIGYGIENWRIFTVFPVGRAREYPELQLEPYQFKKVLDFISATRKENMIKLNYGCEGFLGNYEGEVRDNFFFCRSGINIASILADGSISGCPNMRDNFIQGNIYKDDFREVWKNRYYKFRNREWAKTGICSDCDSFRYCEGNGMHLREDNSGEVLFCHLKKIEEGIISGKQDRIQHCLLPGGQL